MLTFGKLLSETNAIGTLDRCQILAVVGWAISAIYSGKDRVGREPVDGFANSVSPRGTGRHPDGEAGASIFHEAEDGPLVVDLRQAAVFSCKPKRFCNSKTLTY